MLQKMNFSSEEMSNVSGGGGILQGIRKNGERGFYVVEKHVPIAFTRDLSEAELIHKKFYKQKKSIDYLKEVFPNSMLSTRSPVNRASYLSTEQPIIED